MTDPTVTAREWIAVEVAYATPDKQLIVSLNVPRGATAREAVRRSGINAEFPGLRAEFEPMGIFSRPLNGKDLPLPDEYVMQPRDPGGNLPPADSRPQAGAAAARAGPARGRRVRLGAGSLPFRIAATGRGG